MDSTVPPDELLLLEGKLVLYAAYLTVNERERGREREEGGGRVLFLSQYCEILNILLSILYSLDLFLFTSLMLL